MYRLQIKCGLSSPLNKFDNNTKTFSQSSKGRPRKVVYLLCFEKNSSSLIKECHFILRPKGHSFEYLPIKSV